jgi:hypothetical protein
LAKLITVNSGATCSANSNTQGRARGIGERSIIRMEYYKDGSAIRVGVL